MIIDKTFCVQQLCEFLPTDGELDMEYTEADWANKRVDIDLLKLFCETTEVIQGDNFINNSMMPMLAPTFHAFCITQALRHGPSAARQGGGG